MPNVRPVAGVPDGDHRVSQKQTNEGMNNARAIRDVKPTVGLHSNEGIFLRRGHARSTK